MTCACVLLSVYFLSLYCYWPSLIHRREFLPPSSVCVSEREREKFLIYFFPNDNSLAFFLSNGCRWVLLCSVLGDSEFLMIFVFPFSVSQYIEFLSLMNQFNRLPTRLIQQHLSSSTHHYQSGT